jgi:hypothetical protein
MALREYRGEVRSRTNLKCSLLLFAGVDRRRIFARNGKAQMRRTFFAFGLLGIRMTDQVVNFIGQREGNRGLSYAG